MIKSIFDPSMWTAILPRSISYDDQIKSIAAAIDPHLRSVSIDSRESIFLARLDELDHPILDLLASQFHVDFYDDQLSLEQKRQLIRESIADHRLRGTKYAVEKYSRLIFHATNVEEWFDYDGRPYYFRLRIDITDDTESVTVADRDRLRRAIDITKPVRCRLDVLIFVVNYQETINPPEEVYKLRALFKHADTYDYRANINPYDGTGNYGRNPFNYDGIADNYGELGSINYGRFQANDFEIFTVSTILKHSDSVRVDEVSRNQISMQFADTYDYGVQNLSTYNGKNDYGSNPFTYDGIADNYGSISDRNYGRHQADHFEQGNINIRRRVYLDGNYSYDGITPYDSYLNMSEAL